MRSSSARRRSSRRISPAPRPLDQARANRDRAAAAVASAKADLAAAEAERDVLRRKCARRRATLDELKTELAKAERDLAFTEIKAPFDGIIANRAVEPGQYVADRPAPDGAGAGRQRLCRSQSQGNPAGRGACQARRPKSPSMPGTERPYEASSTAFRRLRVPSSRCCRRRTPPATSPRSPSACRCASGSDALCRAPARRPLGRRRYRYRTMRRPAAAALN